MPIIRRADALQHETHGATFDSYAAPSRGSTQLCAWRVTVPAGVQGVMHRPSREEILLILDGELTITLDRTTTTLGPGDVALVAPGSELRVDGGARVASAWVTTVPGIEAVLADGTRMTPPWAV